MLDRFVRTYPIGDKIRGTGLYYNSNTGNKDWSSCGNCSLRLCRRRVSVRLDGLRGYNRQHPTRLLFIGQAPRETENATGIPFTGQSGRILTQIFHFTPAAFEFCLTYLVCCQPKDIEEHFPIGLDEDNVPNNYVPFYEYSNFNRQPNSVEIQACQPHIDQLVKSFRPQGIVYLGATARNNYMSNKPEVLLKNPALIAKEEYKVLPMRKQAKILLDFIKEITK